MHVHAIRTTNPVVYTAICKAMSNNGNIHVLATVKNGVYIQNVTMGTWNVKFRPFLRDCIYLKPLRMVMLIFSVEFRM